MSKPLKILIAPLNWGLGHATRCLPLAHALREHLGAEIHWASDGQALALLRQEEQTCPIHALPGSEVRYPTRNPYLNMMVQGPSLLRQWRREQVAAEALQAKFSFDLILADNRFGFRVKGVPSYCLTHQINLPLTNPLARPVANAINHWQLRKFNRLLIPDYPDHKRDTGLMSTALDGIPCDYLGQLSRFTCNPIPPPSVGWTDLPDLAIVLSGPEPQRTYLEQEVLAKAAKNLIGKHIILVRGLPHSPTPLPKHLVSAVQNSNTLTTYDFLKGADLAQVYRSAKLLVCRSGYTTVMDLRALGKAAIYVPTPGQPEQQLLAQRLAEQKRGITQQQGRLDLGPATLTALDFCATTAELQGTLLEKWIADLPNTLTQKS